VSFTVTEDVRLRVEASGLLFGNVTRGITLLEDNMYVHYDSDVANHSSQVVYDGDFSHLLKAGSTYRLQHWFRVESTPFEDNIAEASMQLSYSIPEPSSTSLLGLGMLGLILRRRR